MTNVATKTVKVAEMRNAYDHIFRQANVNYHSCVGASEILNWKARSERILADNISTKCNRATEYDHQQMAGAIKALTGALSDADSRLTDLEKRNPQIKAEANARRSAPMLKLIK